MRKLEVTYTFIALVIIGLVVFLITINSTTPAGFPLYKDLEFRTSILVEAHGMLLDILLLGVVLVFFIARVEKRHKIESLKKEIDYIRLLKTDEIKFKIKALITQLNDRNIYNLDLHQCYLSNIDLLGIKVIKGKVQAAAFTESNLSNSDFSKTKAERTFFNKSKITNCKFIQCNMFRVNFSGSISRKAFYKDSKLIKCTFDDADLINSDFRGCNLTDSTFINAFARSCDFRNADLKM